MSRVIVLVALVLMTTACSWREEKAIEVNAATPSAQPHLFTEGDSIAYLSWIETIDSVHHLKYAKLIDNHWSDAITIASGKKWFVNWADYPVVAVNGKSFAATFLQKSGDGTFAYDVMLTTSRDGKTWTTPVVLHDDGKQAEHGFVSIIPYNDNFFITWLDGRNTVMEGMEGMEGHEGHHGQMSLRAAVVDADGKKINDWELDNRVCDCCQTSAAITTAGPVVVYRDRSRDEIRDMAIVRMVNGSWTDPQPVWSDNWKIDGCPVNGPRIVADGNDVAVVWYTGAHDKPTVSLAFSDNSGETFSSPTRIDEGQPIGRVDIVLGSSGAKTRAYVSWLEKDDIKFASAEYGVINESSLVAKSSSARASGFPQMVKLIDNKFVFAWTDSEAKTIRSAQWNNVF